MDIQIRAKLSAYTKGTLPTKVSDLENDLDFVTDVPDESVGIYVRKPDKWERLETDRFEPGAGIKIDKITSDYINTYTISAKQWVGTESEFIALDDRLDEGTTYFTYEDSATTEINGGEPDTDFTEIPDNNKLFGGTPQTEIFDIYITPVNLVIEGE